MTANDREQKTLAAAHLARGLSANAVGRLLDIDGRKIRRWRTDPDFERQVEDARRAILAETVGALTDGVRLAVDVLRAALAEDSAGIRVRAAAELLKALPAIAGHAELDARLAALETRLEEQEGRHVLQLV